MHPALFIEDGELVGIVVAPARSSAATRVDFPAMERPGMRMARLFQATTPA